MPAGVTANRHFLDRAVRSLPASAPTNKTARRPSCSRATAAYFPFSIFSFKCFAQASALLFFPCIEFEVLYEYAKAMMPDFRFSTFMLADSAECQLPKMITFAAPAFFDSELPVISNSASSRVSTSVTGTFFDLIASFMKSSNESGIGATKTLAPRGIAVESAATGFTSESLDEAAESSPRC